MTHEEAIERLKAEGYQVVHRRRWALGDTIGLAIPPVTQCADGLSVWAGVIHIYEWPDGYWNITDHWLPECRATTLAGALTLVPIVLCRNVELRAEIEQQIQHRREAARKQP